MGKNQEPDFIYFRSLVDVFLHAVRNENDNLIASISDYFYLAFKSERERSKGIPVIYPADYYSLVHRTIEELCFREKRNVPLEVRTGGSIWLLGELGETEISDNTYLWLWRNLKLVVSYEKDNMVLYHWETADQYFSFYLSRIQSIYDETYTTIINAEAIEKREIERDRFLEFHFALGGLLAYKGRFSCIKRLFNYTQSQPPRYKLLPLSMTDIFFPLNEFIDQHNVKYAWISSKFSFPDQSGLNSDWTIKKWIAYYFAILFLRQYTIIPYLITIKPFDFPSFPSSQGGKSQWINHMDFFKGLVIEILENKSVMENLGLSFITRTWCEKEGKKYPLDYIDELKSALIESHRIGEITQEISIAKINSFKEKSRVILESTFDRYEYFLRRELPTGEFNNWELAGLTMVINRSAFAENPEVDHTNYDYFLAESIADRMRQKIATSFRVNVSTKYVLRKEDFHAALGRLKISNGYQLINFGIDPSKINADLTKADIKLNIIELPGSHEVADSIFIMKISDSPILFCNELAANLRTKYELNELSTKYKLFEKVLDLNATSEEIRTEFLSQGNEDTLNKSVLEIIKFNATFAWKKNIKCVQFIEYSEYRHRGVPVEVSEIIPF